MQSWSLINSLSLNEGGWTNGHGCCIGGESPIVAERMSVHHDWSCCEE